MLGMKTEENMGNLTICGEDLLKLWNTTKIMHICYRNVMDISLEEDL
jgi:hypothetical protein